MVRNLPVNARNKGSPWFGKIPWGEEMATHSSILAWKMPWTEEPVGLQSTGSQRIRHGGHGSSSYCTNKGFLEELLVKSCCTCEEIRCKPGLLVFTESPLG